MAETFFISDTHFGHKKILEFEKELRPFSSIEEHDEALIKNWNSVVTNKDVVYHLGDILFGKNNFHLLYRLKGIKKFILGNHDQYPSEDYLMHTNKLHASYRFDGNILTHIPVHDSQFHRFKHNIHGHLHSKVINDDRYFNVSCERIGLTPINYDEIKSVWK